MMMMMMAFVQPCLRLIRLMFIPRSQLRKDVEERAYYLVAGTYYSTSLLSVFEKIRLQIHQVQTYAFMGSFKFQRVQWPRWNAQYFECADMI